LLRLLVLLFVALHLSISIAFTNFRGCDSLACRKALENLSYSRNDVNGGFAARAFFVFEIRAIFFEVGRNFAEGPVVPKATL